MYFLTNFITELEPSSHLVRTTYINRQNQLLQEAYALAAERSGDEEVNLVKTNTEVPESHLVRAEDSNMNLLEVPVLARTLYYFASCSSPLILAQNTVSRRT